MYCVDKDTKAVWVGLSLVGDSRGKPACSSLALASGHRLCCTSSCCVACCTGGASLLLICASQLQAMALLTTCASAAVAGCACCRAGICVGTDGCASPGHGQVRCRSMCASRACKPSIQEAARRSFCPASRSPVWQRLCCQLQAGTCSPACTA